ncbi:MAG: PaaI family thioesterase [Actinomycetota bacterium]|jgi:uncharacterized protein (TIGR00369 family)|nr:hypothetical protein [Actinomycetota bacterium]MAN33311.1 hypothetical protein [Acidimicrobiaceae bacterium]MBS31751.1 hypothetical protein [Acidimicrobiaceae bacterium]MEC7175864.1 PaaI family thioesterase [Actinomycetota bacterium]MEC7434909.1 PaaI family thioesterase [Actinomycetota bacterium]|tara:strand:+ start:178 stop:615 length:438 start_codon:yes stop_codon:yes gene_type:complete
MRADDFPPISDELLQTWSRFPSWDQDTNMALHMGFIVEDIRAGYARLRMPISPNIMQPAGLIHGGAIASLIDTAVVPALGGVGVEPTRMVTISMNINYMGAISDEDAVCEGWITRQGRSIIFCSAEVTGAQSGKVCATGTLVYKV